MSDGELPKLMQLWAEKECERLGLRQVMLEEKNKLYQETKARAAAILGSHTVEDLESAVRGLALKLGGN